MKFAAILSILLVAAASALADNRDSSEASAAPQAATNPANVIFRILEAPSGGAAVRQQLVHHHHDARPVTYVLHQQPAAQPVFTRFVQHQPAPIQPVFARIVQQPVIAAPAPVPVPVIRTVTQQQQQTAATSAELGPVDPNPSYTFGYEVNAVEDHVHKGHKESRSNGEVTGEYRYVDPNGDLRITTYTAGVNGYNAEVEIQKGYASPAPAPRKQPQQQQIVVAAPAPVSVPAPVPIVRHVHAPVPASTVYRLVSGGHHQQLLATNPHTLVRAVSLPVAAPALRHTGGATFTRIVHTDGTTTEF